MSLKERNLINFTSGFEWINEVRTFLEKNNMENFTLLICDTLTKKPLEVKCKFDDIISVIDYVSHVEHDFPKWIGVYEETSSYIVGLDFTRGHLNTLCTYDWKNNKLMLQGYK